MAFQIKSFVSITASMINRCRLVCTKISDYTVGSIVRSMFESVAQELDQFYQQLVLSLMDAIKTATYTTFNFSALAAVAASGTVTVTITPQTADVTIPVGATFTPAGSTITYAVVSAATIPAGLTTAVVQIACTQTGTGGNLASQTSFTMSAPVAGFVSATNTAKFSNGAAAETSDARLARFNEFILSLARSTVYGIDYGLSSVSLTDANGNITEAVKFKTVVEPYLSDPTKPTANIYAYIHNGVGSTSTALIAAAQTVVDGSYEADGTPVPGYKAAGVVCTVLACPEETVAVTGVITPEDGYDLTDLESSLSSAHSTYLLSLAPGQSAEVMRLYALAEEITGISDFVMSVPAADVAPSTAWTKLMPGTGSYS
ncbi:MAG: baseplate J/gp47 family protein [Acetobacter aceti]